ncbi:MAG TPA: acyl-CoA synthetase [Gemmataceae bacterium]|nr:acyl-CoA synthetase [Gemmataceae bacterium]
MSLDYAELCRSWDPWSVIPSQYNLGVALTRGQVEQGRGDKPALLWENAAGQTRSITYRQLDALSSRLASSLARLGVRHGDRVFLRLPNVPEFYVAALGTAKLGAVFIPSSTQFRDAEVRYRLNDSEAVVAIVTRRLVDTIERVRGDCPGLRHVLVVADETGPAPGGDLLDFTALVNQGNESHVPAATRHDDLAFLAYTSGTTGDPKGVVHLQRYPIAYESLVRHWHDYREDDIVACPSELGWVLPVASTFLYALAHGLTVVLYDPQGGRFDPEKWFALFERYRITNFTAPPTTYRMLMAAADAARPHDLKSWRHGVSAGEPLPGDTLDALRRHFGITVLDGIGMTECMVYAFNMVGAPLKLGSCGRPGPNTMIELLDDDLQPVPLGQDGQLCVRRDTHPGMLREYWRKPERTADVFRGPWYCSGDVLARDEDGYLWFKGRNDDVIKASGYRISPFEVESCLVSHPAVLEAAAVESPDPLRGRVVKVFLVLREGIEPGESLRGELQEFAKRQMAGYKCPRKIEFVAALPKTPSGKIKRKELRERETGVPG